MHEAFKRPYSCDWLVWIGMPLLYDGALCVERDYDTKSPLKLAVSLDTNHRIITQWETQ